MTLSWVSTKKPALKSRDPETGRKFEKLVAKRTYDNKSFTTPFVAEMSIIFKVIILYIDSQR